MAARVANLPFRYDVAADRKRFLVKTVANGPVYGELPNWPECGGF
jgi:hypothetical protein